MYNQCFIQATSHTDLTIGTIQCPVFCPKALENVGRRNQGSNMQLVQNMLYLLSNTCNMKGKLTFQPICSSMQLLTILQGKFWFFNTHFYHFQGYWVAIIKHHGDQAGVSSSHEHTHLFNHRKGSAVSHDVHYLLIASNQL